MLSHWRSLPRCNPLHLRRKIHQRLPPVRFAALFMGNGVNPHHWGAKAGPGGIEFAKSLSPLAPHAGEGGALGREEADWLCACLEQWRRDHPGVTLEGPLPPDTCWLEAAGAWRGEGPAADGYLALYHDQGLIPVKLLAFDAAVNTTLGLPFLRTSPDHGTAFAIAGRGVAREQSMAAALETARQLG